MNVETVTALEADLVKAQTAERAGTPLFVYSARTLRAQIARIRAATAESEARLLFATMANDRPEVLDIIAAEGVGACVNSIPHLKTALAHGFGATHVQFTSCGVPRGDMVELQTRGILANLDSPAQIEMWCGLSRGAVAGARINARALERTAPPDRIGMDLRDFDRARALANRLGGRVNGIHVYVGTNFQSASDMLPVLGGAFDLASRCADVDYLNIGGGIGVDYKHTHDGFDYERFGAEVAQLARRASEARGRPLRLFFEPGRSLVASAGEFITRVTDIKEVCGTRFVVVDASVSLFPRPYHQPGSWHRVRVLGGAADSAAVTSAATIAGRTTFSRDIFGTYQLPAALPVGALLAFEDAGAYCESMMSRFLGQSDPKVHMSES